MVQTDLPILNHPTAEAAVFRPENLLARASEMMGKGSLGAVLARRAAKCGLPVHRGPTWTTDAPYRETRTQIERHRADGVLTSKWRRQPSWRSRKSAGQRLSPCST